MSNLRIMEGQQLPKATMSSFIKKHTDLHISPDSLVHLLHLAKNYVERLSHKSNQICEKNQKKTINVEHLSEALKIFQLNHHLFELKKLGSDLKECQELKRQANRRLEESIQREKRESHESYLAKKSEKREITQRQKFEVFELPQVIEDNYELLANPNPSQ